MLALVFAVPYAAADSGSEPTDVKLTEKQRKELASQYKEILKKEEKLIATYVKYGVLTKEQGDRIIAHLNKRYMKLEQHGFVPKWKHHHMKDDSHHKHHGQDHQHHHDQHKHHQRSAE